jgi:hypothetical protein
MLAASLLGIFFIPVSFVVIEKLGHLLGGKKAQDHGVAGEEVEGARA